MRRISKRLAGLALAGMWAAAVPALGAGQDRSPGAGPAYELIGKVAVMHEGRVKPLDTVAREEVKQIYGRETIKLRDPNEEIEKIIDPESRARKAPPVPEWQKWGPVGAFHRLDGQPRVLGRPAVHPGRVSPLETPDRGGDARDPAQGDRRQVDDPRRREGYACRSWPPDRSRPLQSSPPYLRGSKLPLEDKKTIAEVAVKLSEEHKWLTPRELEEAKITDKDHAHPFIDWASELQEQKRQFDANPQSAPRLTEIERRAIEVAMRLSTYKAYSGERFQKTGLILIMPRPNNAKYLAETAKTIKEAREKGDPRDLPLFKLDELKAISTFWNDIPRDDRHDPTEDATFDERYTAWLRDNSVWVPLKVMLKSKPEELVEAGYPESQVRAFLDAYRELEQAESSSPGHVSEAAAAKFLAASRELGEAVNPTKYPTVATIERETHFNAMNPFYAGHLRVWHPPLRSCS